MKYVLANMIKVKGVTAHVNSLDYENIELNRSVLLQGCESESDSPTTVTGPRVVKGYNFGNFDAGKFLVLGKMLVHI